MRAIPRLHPAIVVFALALCLVAALLLGVMGRGHPATAAARAAVPRLLAPPALGAPLHRWHLANLRAAPAVARAARVVRIAQTHATAAPHHTRRSLRPVLLRVPTISIPRLGIRAPIHERGVDRTGHLPIAPGYGVTHLSFSARAGEPGNAVIYGHDDIEGSIFRYLPDMAPGDRVYVEEGGHRFTYSVTERRIVSPRALSVLEPTTTSTLTLISCTPYWVDTQRIVVRARLLARD